MTGNSGSTSGPTERVHLYHTPKGVVDALGRVQSFFEADPFADEGEAWPRCNVCGRAASAGYYVGPAGETPKAVTCVLCVAAHDGPPDRVVLVHKFSGLAFSQGHRRDAGPDAQWRRDVAEGTVYHNAAEAAAAVYGFGLSESAVEAVPEAKAAAYAAERRG